MRTVAGAKEFGVQAGQPIVDFSVSQGRKQKVVDTLYKGLVGPDEEPGDHHLQRIR